MKINAIYGTEPMREGEYPTSFLVGYGKPPVEAITYREHNYGDHGLGWFDVTVEGQVVASMAARAVAEIRYEPEDPGEPVMPERIENKSA